MSETAAATTLTLKQYSQGHAEDSRPQYWKILGSLITDKLLPGLTHFGLNYYEKCFYCKKKKAISSQVFYLWRSHLDLHSNNEGFQQASLSSALSRDVVWYLEACGQGLSLNQASTAALCDSMFTRACMAPTRLWASHVFPCL